MGGEGVIRKPADVCAAKQSFPSGSERFPGKISPGTRKFFVKWVRADTQHADDAATTSLPGLGRVFSHAQQGDPKRFAPEIPESGARAQNRHGDRERSHTLHR